MSAARSVGTLTRGLPQVADSSEVKVMFNELPFARTAHADPVADHIADLRQYRWLSAVIFTYFLVVAVLALPLPRRWRPFASPSGERRSIVSQVRAATHNVMPYVFLG